MQLKRKKGEVANWSATPKTAMCIAKVEIRDGQMVDWDCVNGPSGEEDVDDAGWKASERMGPSDAPRRSAMDEKDDGWREMKKKHIEMLNNLTNALGSHDGQTAEEIVAELREENVNVDEILVNLKAWADGISAIMAKMHAQSKGLKVVKPDKK